MKTLLCIISVIFGGLSMVAAIVQMRTEKKILMSAAIMAVGAALLIIAVIFNIVAQKLDFLIAICGCAGICASAIHNGIKSGNFHIRHHVVRITLSLILIAGFVVL